MSAPKKMKETERIHSGVPHGRGPMAGGMVGQKSLDFGPSAKRLFGRLRPERFKVGAIVTTAIASMSLFVLGPRVLGRATDIIFAGAIGGSMPDGATKSEMIEAARDSGQAQVADLLSGIDLVPGQGIDFSALGGVLLTVVALYVGSSLLGFLQGFLLNDVVQKTVYRMRSEVEDKINRLPLSYFDHQPRGELLSRVTNDMDNLGQTLQQTMSQVLTSLLTIVLVVAMMFVISPVLALIALVTIPVSMVVAGLVMRRSRTRFVDQWRRTGALNAQIEEAFTGHELTKVFGRHEEVQATFEEENEELYEASFGAQFLSGLIMPIMMFVGNLNYVVIAVLGGLRVASGTLSLGDVQAFIQYSRRFTQPVTQVASMVNLLQSGVASAERVFELLDAEEESSDDGQDRTVEVAHGRVSFEGISFRYEEDQPLIEDLSLAVEPGQTVAIVGPTGAGKTTLVNLVMRFYELDGGRITLDGVEMKLAPKRGQTIMNLCDELDIEIPRFCYHEELTIPANCRMCLVEVEKAPKLLPACHTELREGLVIHTRNERVKRSQEAVLEFMLVNHPVDCPICDQAGECPLQDQYAVYDARATRIGDPVTKVKKRKRVELGPRVTLDQERCILCSRCVRFMDEVAKAPQLGIFWRNDHAYLETFPDEPLDSGYSLNTVQICPVGALTSTDFRFQARSWNLQTTAGLCDGCDRGCNTWVDQKDQLVKRLRARDNLAVNRYWMCDEGRLSYDFVNETRLLTPRHQRGEVAPAGSSLQLAALLAEKLRPFKDEASGSLAFLVSARISTEDALAAAYLAAEVFGAKALYVGGRDAGEADAILLRADRNPNRLGVKLAAEAFGLEVKDFDALLSAVDAGTVKRLHAVGTDVPTDPEMVAPTFANLEWFSCSATNLDPLVAQADVALPAATMVECEGTFVNAFGRAQRFGSAFEARGEAASHWEWLLEIARVLGAEAQAEDAAGIWAELAGRSPVLGSVEWGEVSAEGLALDGVGAGEDDPQTGGRGVRHERGISRWPR